jgi:predicted O-methyltransferase YrrM
MTTQAPAPPAPTAPQRTLSTDLLAVAEFLDCQARIAHVRGWLHAIEGFTLMQLAAYAPGEGCVVEVGSFKGLSSCWLGMGVERRGAGVVYAVDHFKGSPEHQPGQSHADPDVVASGSTLPAFRANVQKAGLEKFVEPVELASLDAARAWPASARGPIRLLFIDGDHSYQASKADFEAWRPHLARGALVCFHDVGSWEGVTRYYQELADATIRQELALRTLRVCRII